MRYRDNLAFPIYELPAAQLLLERGVVGIDTLSPDPEEGGFPVHWAVLGAGGYTVYILENLAHLRKLPPRGAWAAAFPIPIEGGMEAFARVIGLIPNAP